jgi:hypothetical protein
MEYSKNDRAEKIMGRRLTKEQEENNEIVVAIDQPAELDYHCPVCKYPLTSDGDYDERLHWSEYAGMLWCGVCNRDYPSCLCMPDITRAIDIFLDTVEEAIASNKKK